MENLCDLPYDSLVDIARRLKKLEDFTCFRSVSKFLRTFVEEEYFEGLRFRQGTPYLMLPVRDGNDNIRELYSLVEGESIATSVEVPKFKSKMCFESLGWLLTVEVDGSMSLLDPFSGTEIPVPHQNTFPEYDELIMDADIFIQKMVLSSRPNETSDFILMIIAGGLGHLGFWRLGDEAWNRIEEEDRKGRFKDVVYDGGEQFYAIGNPGIIWVINLAGNDNHVECRIIVSEHIPHANSYTVNQYILKTADGSLLGITRFKDELSFITNEFHLYELDTEKNTWKEIYSLGSMAVFVGYNSSIIVDASRFPGGVIKANHIYFTDDFYEINHVYFTSTEDEWKSHVSEEAKGGCVDSGVYNLETRAIEPIYPVEPLLSRVCPAMWITPNLCF